VYRHFVSTDGNSSSPAPHGTLEEDKLGFVLEANGASALLPCKLVRGFQDAIAAAQDPRTPMPSRLVIVSPDVVTFEWLAQWAEDDQQVRRTLTIRRRCDGATVTAVVTLAAYGHATETALTVESLTLPSQRRRIVRSGVHPKSFLDAILAHHKRAGQSANDTRVQPPDPPTSDAT
jgi:hypothetical protein